MELGPADRRLLQRERMPIRLLIHTQAPTDEIRNPEEHIHIAPERDSIVNKESTVYSLRTTDTWEKIWKLKIEFLFKPLNTRFKHGIQPLDT